MKTLFETWCENENKLEALFEKLNTSLEDRQEFRLLQVECQRDELRAIKNELNN